MKSLLILSLSLWLIGCVSATPQSEKFLDRVSADAGSHSLPRVTQVEKVPFIPQSDNYCGPATLTMAMNWAGQNTSMAEVAPQVFTPGMKGTLQTDMITASRRQGLMAVPIAGIDSLFAEVAAGNPVIVFENLALSWLPQWHYALVFGYDLNQENVLMHSGPEASKQWDLRKFERSWKLADYWGLVVLPAGKLSATADELTQVKAAAALENIGKLDQADKAYAALLEKWPNSLVPAIGRANIAYTKKDFLLAVKILKRASIIHPNSSVVWHNLAVAKEAAEQSHENF